MLTGRDGRAKTGRREAKLKGEKRDERNCKELVHFVNVH